MGLKVLIQVVITAAVLLYSECEPTRLPIDAYQVSGPVRFIKVF
jgi:hypothetical protein